VIMKAIMDKDMRRSGWAALPGQKRGERKNGDDIGEEKRKRMKMMKNSGGGRQRKTVKMKTQA